MNKRINLINKQRSYLKRLIRALNMEIDFTDPNPTEMKNTVRFISKIIKNDYYHKQSASSITMVCEDYKHLIKKYNL